MYVCNFAQQINHAFVAIVGASKRVGRDLLDIIYSSCISPSSQLGDEQKILLGHHSVNEPRKLFTPLPFIVCVCTVCVWSGDEIHLENAHFCHLFVGNVCNNNPLSNYPQKRQCVQESDTRGFNPIKSMF